MGGTELKVATSGNGAEQYREKEHWGNVVDSKAITCGKDGMRLDFSKISGSQIMTVQILWLGAYCSSDFQDSTVSTGKQ